MCHKKRLAGIIRLGMLEKSQSSKRGVLFPIPTVFVFFAKVFGPNRAWNRPGRQ